MSWIEKIQTKIVITTGDGRSYSPNWMNAIKSKEYQISQFEFIEVEGSLISRGTPMGRKFTLELFFQGENHLDEAERFEVSADDKRSWTVAHPYYGEFLAQPISIIFDNKDHNVSKITAVVIETISEDNPKINVRAEDKIVLDKINLDIVYEISFVNDVPVLRVKDLNQLTSNTATIYNQGKKSILDTVDFEAYFNLFNEANTAIANAIQFPTEAIRAVQAMINAPIYFANTVENRLENFAAQFDSLRNTITNLLTKQDKKIYENNMGVIVSAMAQTCVTNFSYDNRTDVLSAIEILLDRYNQLITDLDSLQSLNGGNPDAYVPDADSISGLTDLINFTISNLFLVAIDAKQERIVYLEEDSNVIILAHRFYGIDSDDAAITQIINDNQIGLNELLQIQKGRAISYFV